MGKTIKGKDKAARKTAAAKRKIARKTKGGRNVVVAIVCAFALAILAGCATSDSAQPAKSQTQNNRFDGCVFVMATRATVSNGVVRASGEDIQALEMFTQTQSLESTGSTENNSQTSTQTPTTDVKPDIDVHYNDAVGTGGYAVKSFLSTLTTESFKAVRDYIKNRKSGSVTVTTIDGKTETLTCEGGTCTRSDGTAITEDDCDNCRACGI